MCKFAHTTYEKILTDLLSFLRGLSFNEKKLDYVKMLDDIIIDMWPLWDEYKKNAIRYLSNNRSYLITYLI